MTEEQKELYNAYKSQCDSLWHIAHRLDSFFPETLDAFKGTPSERIARQLNKILETDVFEGAK